MVEDRPRFPSALLLPLRSCLAMFKQKRGETNKRCRSRSLQEMFAAVASSTILAVLITGTLTFSLLFVLRYRSRREKDTLSLIVVSVGLTLCFSTLALVPIDVWLASMENSAPADADKPEDGTSWRKNIKWMYMILYGAVAWWCWVMIPFSYFFHEERDDLNRISLGKRILNAMKYSIGFLLVVILMMVGAVLINARSHSGDNLPGDAELDRLKRLIGWSVSDQSLSFLLGILVLLGMLVLMSYTAIGLAVIPIRMLKSTGAPPMPMRRTSAPAENEFQHATTIDDLRMEVTTAREKRRAVLAKYPPAVAQDRVTKHDQKLIQELLEEEVELERQIKWLEEHGRGFKWLKLKLRPYWRPIEVSAGVLLYVISFTLAVSVIITNAQVLAKSLCGRAKCDFVWDNPGLFSPVNTVLKFLSVAFPLDLILFACVITFVFYATLSGITQLGVRCLCVNLFKVRPHKTSPQGLLLLSFLLMASLLSLQQSLFALAPEYVSYGSLSHSKCTVAAEPGNSTSTSGLFVQFVNTDETVCNPTVFSVLTRSIVAGLPNVYDMAFRATQWAWGVITLLCLMLGWWVIKSDPVPTVTGSYESLEDDSEEDEEIGLVSNRSHPQSPTSPAGSNSPGPTILPARRTKRRWYKGKWYTPETLPTAATSSSQQRQGGSQDDIYVSKSWDFEQDASLGSPVDLPPNERPRSAWWNRLLGGGSSGTDKASTSE